MPKPMDLQPLPRLIAWRIALIYLFVSLFWIYAGDQLLLNWMVDPTILTYWQTIKGGLFVLFSAALIYVLMYKALQSLRSEQMQAQRLAAMTKHSPAVTICWRNAPGWPVSFVSANIAQWGYTAENFHSGDLTYESLIHPDDLPRVNAEIDDYVTKGTDGFRQQYRLRHSNGDWLWLEDRTWLVRDEQGKITEFHGVLIDITEEIQLREQLRAGAANYKLLFEANPHPMWVYDLDSLAFLAVNGAAVAHYGYSDKEFLNMTIKDIRPEEDVDRLKENIAHVTDGIDQAGIWQHITKDGRLLSVEIVSHTLSFDGRRAEVILAHDVTERLQIEKALLERNAALEQFHYTISHDLRTPLVTIESFLGFLEQDMDGSDRSLVTRDMEHIRNATRRMRGMLDDLGKLLLAKTDESSSVTTFTALIDNVRHLVAGVVIDRGATLKVFPAHLSLKANQGHLVQIWQNLIENAVKYMGDQEQPIIAVGVEEGAIDPVFYVQDNGMGINKMYQQKIFGLFDQIDINSSGSGLGLALVKRIVEVYGGRIWVESDGSGHGSCFKFTLPVAVKKGPKSNPKSNCNNI